MYLIPFAAVALASCSNESTDSQQSRVAQSNTAALNIVPVVQGTTRGAIMTDASITTFKVVATGEGGDFFSVKAGEPLADDYTTTQDYALVGTSFDATITKSDNKWPIASGKDYYWSSKSMTGTFKAWWPDNVDFNTPATVYTVKNKLTDQEDVICAYNAGAASDFTAGVPLNFQHALSQVVIKALNKDAGKIRVEVAGVKLNNLVNAGTLKLPSTPTTSGVFTWPADTWSLSSSTDIYIDGGKSASATAVQENIITLTSAAKQLTSEPFILMPQTTAKADLTQPNVTGAYFSILVRVTELSNPEVQKYPTLNSSTQDAKNFFAYVAIPVDIDWKPGYKYTYTLNFSEKGIGKVDPTQPTEGKPNPLDGYPNADVDPGDDIFDSPVPLFFTVSVENWTDAATSPLDM